ncbi:hypothetical protein KAX08_03900 [candidate division WOR-3 bacterium]|nr:hypothetical protein [candidate division WOR-3 bacterium]
MAHSDEEKYLVWQKCNGRCVYGQCIRVNLKEHGITWEIDHANPDGVDDLRNWVVACFKHNRQKGNMTRQEFKRWIIANDEENCGI